MHMRLIVTGGGTGGHVYPALEIAKAFSAAGADVTYFGSLRGIERDACEKANVRFFGLQSAPLGKPWTPSGLAGYFRLAQSIAKARRAFASNKPDCVFSTGGYAAGPSLQAARSLGIPVVLHEQNAIPGRTHRIAAKFAERICGVFEETGEHFPSKFVRTGMPIREELIEASKSRTDNPEFQTLCIGGSQGASALNEAVLSLALRVGEQYRWLHVSGPKLYEATATAAERLSAQSGYRVVPFLDAPAMASALSASALAIARAGAGVVSELALFGIPAIFVPYPLAHADHQTHNAAAIVKIGGASLIAQSDVTPERLETEWTAWARDEGRRMTAASSLRNWSIPDATERVRRIIEEVASASGVRSR